MDDHRDPDGELWDAIRETRVIRMLLDLMWSQVDQLPDEVLAGEEVLDALAVIRRWLNAAEAPAMRARLLAWQHLVIRPVSLASPPPPQALAEITAAIAALDRHGLIAARID